MTDVFRPELSLPTTDAVVGNVVKSPRRQQRKIASTPATTIDKLPLWEWQKPRRAIYHPRGNRHRVLCEDCGKFLSTFPESVDPEPSFAEDEVGGISLYWCKKCTERMELRLDREHAAKVAAELQALRASQRRQ